MYNSYLKKYLDSGYVRLSKLTYKKESELSEDDIKTLLGDSVTDQSGIPKPMLAKSSDQCSVNIFDKEWYVSRKLNGVRCLMYFKDGEVHTASRGGGTYDIATTHIRTDEHVINFFQQNPDIILDGELYKHDVLYPLQRISGLARLQEWDDECSKLEYWVYDLISKEPFSKRYEFLENSEWYFENTNIKILEQKPLSGWQKIEKEHNLYVSEGFEGLVARNPNKEYGINKRSGIYMVKLKKYQDQEFEIVGVKEGLRPEDMCFILKTAEGKEFSAKPTGNADTRVYYIEHPEDFIGKQATCKFFEWSSDNIPLQPILIHIRPEDE
jgi:ATP-dependent DNA ligase